MDIRVERTRKMLLDAFEELFEKKDLDQISVSEICELSTVRRATFYRHFSDKYDLFRYYLASITDRLMANAPGTDELGELIPYASYMHRSLIQYVLKNRAATKALSSQNLTAENMDMMIQQVAKGIVERIRANAVPQAEFIGCFYAAGLIHSLRQWIIDGYLLTPNQLEHQATAILESSVAGRWKQAPAE